MPLIEVLSITVAACSFPSAVLFLSNLRYFRKPIEAGESVGGIAVLIPARNEEQNIGSCLDCVLASCEVQFEVLVYDDGSTDRTASIVTEMAKRDNRLRLLNSAGLPSGWNGKQHACWRLANSTDARELLFLDADVRLTRRAIARCTAERRRRNVALLSGFPRQITVGFLEKMLLPLINFVLLSFLPMSRMHKTTKPAYAAGCGQFFLTERDSYFACGGHAAIRQTRHDGLMLPRLFREQNFRTDIVDLTELAEVRMYGASSDVWQGLAKNATEGLADPRRIVLFTVLLLFGQVAPVIAACLWLLNPEKSLSVSALLWVSLLSSYGTRLLAAHRFKLSWAAAILHPLGVFVLLTLQWYALIKQVSGKPVTWRARTYPGDPSSKK